MTQLPTLTERPELRRDPHHRAVAGVASGLAEHLGIPTWWVRLAFTGAVFMDGLGLVLYAAFWALVPVRLTQEPPGLSAASRSGMRPMPRQRGADPGIVLSVAAIVLGAALFLGGGFIPDRMLWPLILAGAGVFLIWLHVDRVQPGLATSGGLTRARVFSALRLLGGLLLVGLGTSWLLATQIGMGQLPAVLGAAGVLLGGFVLVAAPWLSRARLRLQTADAERLKAQARADVAAHLHDSVLQSLALIQRQASDPAAVASIARRQERELRAYLYAPSQPASSLRTSLDEIRDEVEEQFDISVEVVCVGDQALDEQSEAVVQATREAVMNAAKHSNAAHVDVFAEAEPGRLEIFVRDRGEGFSLDAIPPDRMGVRESIRARVERQGGTVDIESAPGRGTEVRLELAT